MLFGKLLVSTFTLAAMAVSHVACAPTAEPETAVIEKRGGASDKMSKCYSDVQNKCSDIDNWLSQHGNVIDVDVVVEVEVKLQGICDLITQLCVDIKAEIDLGVSAEDIQGCGHTFVLLVNLLCTLLLKIISCCKSGAAAILLSVVLQIKVQIVLCSTLVKGCIEGLLGTLLGLLLGLLRSLLGDIDVCISAFVSACGKF